MSLTPAQILETIDALRSRGAKMVRVHPDGGVEAIFDGPAKAAGEKDPEADLEAAKRKKASERTLDDRLLRPLRISKDDAA